MKQRSTVQNLKCFHSVFLPAIFGPFHRPSARRLCCRGLSSMISIICRAKGVLICCQMYLTL